MAETVKHALIKCTALVTTEDVTSQVLKSGTESYSATGEMSEWHAGTDPLPQAAWAEERTVPGSGSATYDLATLNGGTLNGKKVIAVKLVAPKSNVGSLTVNVSGTTNALAGLGEGVKLYPGGVLVLTLNAGAAAISATNKIVKIDNDSALVKTVRMLAVVGNAAP